jgi:two-component system chemotaxis response regulator CheY
MNGLELVQEVRRFDKEVAILMVTTEAGRSRVLQAIEAGVNDYLIKPFTADNLSSKIKKLTGA